MLNLKISVRTSFQGVRKINQATERAKRRAFFRMGSYLRGIARRMVKRRKKASEPGKPPHTRKGQLKRAILFSVEGRGDLMSLVVGPSASEIGKVMFAHEHGERFQGRNYPERPLMRPALEAAKDKFPEFFRGTIH